jgi:4-oxalocrotonate tautomerase family enzyme
MIFITVKMPNKVFDLKKKELLEKLSQTAADSLDIPVEDVAVLIDDTTVSDNFAIGGKQFVPLSKQLEEIFNKKVIPSVAELEDAFTDGTVNDCISQPTELTEEQKSELFDELINIASNPEKIVTTAQVLDYNNLQEKLEKAAITSLQDDLNNPEKIKQAIEKLDKQDEEIIKKASKGKKKTKKV